MESVEPDVRFRCLVQILGIRPVVHDGEMIVRSTRVVGGPPENGQVAASDFERWPLCDFDMRGLLRWWRNGLGLRKRCIADEQAADRRSHHHFEKHRVHGKTPSFETGRPGTESRATPCPYRFIRR